MTEVTEIAQHLKDVKDAEGLSYEDMAMEIGIKSGALYALMTRPRPLTAPTMQALGRWANRRGDQDFLNLMATYVLGFPCRVDTLWQK